MNSVIGSTVGSGPSSRGSSPFSPTKFLLLSYNGSTSDFDPDSGFVFDSPWEYHLWRVNYPGVALFAKQLDA